MFPFGWSGGDQDTTWASSRNSMLGAPGQVGAGHVQMHKHVRVSSCVRVFVRACARVRMCACACMLEGENSGGKGGVVEQNGFLNGMLVHTSVNWHLRASFVLNVAVLSTLDPPTMLTARTVKL